ncbi:GRAM domain-containing protein [Ureibacillus acetophenoni]|uniref:GRAM domain-containing protein n=1 Tax=Ureibacillus acetophenoni TaxID=614649 RepID=A0A285UHF1_9BACL|nr:GRAM domain-containing protein [Ureibacillus acetophenoni]SOC40026.1 GRAM domain-containing protein [Ureibacillus acetophenoni]
MAVSLQIDEKFLVEKTPANLYKGLEAVGGHLTITDKRLIFNAYKFNIQGGTTEILLSDIVSIDRAKSLKIIPNKMIVNTNDGKSFKFVVYKRDKLIQLITDHLK